MLACPGIILLEVYSGRKPAEYVPKFSLRYVMLLERIWRKHIFPAPACITFHLACHLVQSSSKALPMASMQHKTGFIQILCPWGRSVIICLCSCIIGCLVRHLSRVESGISNELSFNRVNKSKCFL